MRIECDSGGFIESIDTVWNDRVFGFRTNEITGFVFHDQSDCLELLDLFERHCLDGGYRLSAFRVDAGEALLKKELQEHGWRFVEHSVRVSLGGLRNRKMDETFGGLLQLARPNDQDFEVISRIAESSFHYGRFQEDPWIGKKPAAERHKSWISDMRKQGREFLVYRPAGDAVSFMAYEIRQGAAELILGGSADGYGFISPRFWTSVLHFLAEEGCDTVRTLISGSNKGVFNLYSRLGFQIKQVFYGFHKMREA